MISARPVHLQGRWPTKGPPAQRLGGRVPALSAVSMLYRRSGLHQLRTACMPCSVVALEIAKERVCAGLQRRNQLAGSAGLEVSHFA